MKLFLVFLCFVSSLSVNAAEGKVSIEDAAQQYMSANKLKTTSWSTLAVDISNGSALKHIGTMSITINKDSVGMDLYSFPEINENPGMVQVVNQNYKIIEHQEFESGYHYFSGKVGNIGFSGTLDLRKPSAPKIKFQEADGSQITNISKEGLAYKEKYLPKLWLGDWVSEIRNRE